LNPETVQFVDAAKGIQSAVALRDFGDFLVWRKDDLPAYQLASVVDDIQMGVTEVVRGEDLITSTFRQILLWRAFSQTPPNFYHCSLIRDEGGARLAKRDNARSIRTFREEGFTPSEIFRTIAAM
jgi:glutamyl-tRNA synthetase